jgi:xanthine dehydrogenase iron-sulfur cluster and FAD-binding subunit A
MECPSIVNIRFSEKDLEALEAIRRAERNGEWLQKTLPVGVMATIFLGNKAPEASFNIASTDWVLFTQSMNSIGPMVRRRVGDIAKMQRLRQALTYQQRQFWEAVDNGCRGR